MTTQEVKRKLAAILSADVKGYSRLMGEDEKGTVRTLNAYKELMIGLIQHHRGRVVDAPGDNVLAEFASVVDAVECAAEIQKELKTRNAELPENRRMEFRIGVNLGDVIEDGEQILGDGVNIAARLESLSEAGGICISGTAYDQVENKLSLGYEYLGEQSVKNIAKPVRVYRVLMEPMAAGKVIGKRKAKPKQWQMATIGLVVILIVVVAAIVIWKYYIPSAPQPEVTPKEKIAVSQPVKAPTVAPPSTEVAPKEKLVPPSPEKVSKPTVPPAQKVEVASKEKMAFPLPDKPSIAVLPFTNMSGDPKQEVLCDGLTDTIITSLSRIPHLFVIASNSTFTYKGKPVKVQQVAEDLGVRYVLEGSMQKAEKRIRLRAQLIDAITGRHLWAESYDRSLEDIFALQDEIASKVITSLQVELTSAEYARAIGKRTKNLEALELFWRGQYHLTRMTKEDTTLARQYAEKAIEIDPEFSTAWTELGFTHVHDSMFGWSSSREQSLKLSEGCAQKALSLNPSEPKAFMLLCSISVAKKEHDKAVEYAERAVEANPNDPWALVFLGSAMRWVGRFEEAIANVRKAMRLTPFYPAAPLATLGYSSFHLRRYDDALSAGEKLLERCRKGELPDSIGYLLMVAIYTELGQEEKARKYATEFLSANPNWNLEVMKRFWVYKNQSDLDRLLNATRKAGLK